MGCLLSGHAELAHGVLQLGQLNAAAAVLPLHVHAVHVLPGCATVLAEKTNQAVLHQLDRDLRCAQLDAFSTTAAIPG